MSVIDESGFVESFELVQKLHHKMMVDKGFHNPTPEKGSLVAMIHGEVSEALEAERTGKVSDKIPSFTGVEEEMADVILRIMDYAGKHKLRIAEALVCKMMYNSTREHKHGKKF